MKNTNFVHGYKNGFGKYIEVFKNPSQRDLRAFDATHGVSARAFLTLDGDLFYWTPEELHVEASRDLELNRKDVVPLELHLDQGIVYITDNLQDRFGGSSATWEEKVERAKRVINKYRTVLEAAIGKFKVTSYGDFKETLTIGAK